MQKVVTVKVVGDGSSPYSFDEIKEVNKLLQEGYQVKSVNSCPAPKKAFHCVFLLVLEKE